jgi:hypothetical protein
VTYKVRNDGSPTESVFQYGSGICLGNFQRIESVRTERFQPGIFRVNPVTIEKSTGISSTSTGQVYYRLGATGYKRWDGNFSCFGAGYLYSHRDSKLFDYNTSRAQASMAKSVANATNLDLNLATDLAELSETIAMIRDPVCEFVKMLRTPTEWRSKASLAATVKRRVNARAYADQTASSWLLYRYGLVPLAKQIESYLEYFSSQLENVELHKLRRAKGSCKAGGDVSFSYSNITTPFNVKLSFQGSINYKVKSTTSTYYTFIGIPTKQERLGLSALDIPEAVWERLYLSFVWDWFIGIGDWLAGLKFDLYRELTGMCTSHKVVETCTISCTKATNSTGTIIYDTPSDVFSTTTERLVRVVNPNSSLPRIPVVNSAMNLLRQIDAVTLLWQRLPRTWR